MHRLTRHAHLPLNDRKLVLLASDAKLARRIASETLRLGEAVRESARNFGVDFAVHGGRRARTALSSRLKAALSKARRLLRRKGPGDR